jgi:hypothetical protein
MESAGLPGNRSVRIAAMEYHGLCEDMTALELRGGRVCRVSRASLEIEPGIQMKYFSFPVGYPPPVVAIWTWS